MKNVKIRNTRTDDAYSASKAKAEYHNAVIDTNNQIVEMNTVDELPQIVVDCPPSTQEEN